MACPLQPPTRVEGRHFLLKLIIVCFPSTNYERPTSAPVTGHGEAADHTEFLSAIKLLTAPLCQENSPNI